MISNIADEYCIDGIQSVRYAPEGSLFIWAYRYGEIEWENEAPKMPGFHSTNKEQYCLSVPWAAESPVWFILHM